MPCTSPRSPSSGTTCKVEPEDQSTILRLLTERHDDLVNERTRIVNRLHAVLRDLPPGGAPTRLSAEKAAALMKGVRPSTATDACRRGLARDLLADLRRIDRQVRDNEAQMRDALAAARTALTALPGLGTVLAAKLPGHVGDGRVGQRCPMGARIRVRRQALPGHLREHR